MQTVTLNEVNGTVCIYNIFFLYGIISRFVKNLTIALNLLLLTDMITNYQINDIISSTHLILHCSKD